MKISPRNPPRAERNTASNPRPSMSSLWPGSTARAVVSLGAPRNMEGMKSINTWVMDIAMIPAAMGKGETYWTRKGERESMTAATRFMCTPGIIPVKIPKAMPIAIAARISMNISGTESGT